MIRLNTALITKLIKIFLPNTSPINTKVSTSVRMEAVDLIDLIVPTRQFCKRFCS